MCLRKGSCPDTKPKAHSVKKTFWVSVGESLIAHGVARLWHKVTIAWTAPSSTEKNPVFWEDLQSNFCQILSVWELGSLLLLQSCSSELHEVIDSYLSWQFSTGPSFFHTGVHPSDLHTFPKPGIEGCTRDPGFQTQETLRSYVQCKGCERPGSTYEQVQKEWVLTAQCLQHDVHKLQMPSLMMWLVRTICAISRSSTSRRRETKQKLSRFSRERGWDCLSVWSYCMSFFLIGV